MNSTLVYINSHPPNTSLRVRVLFRGEQLEARVMEQSQYFLIFLGVTRLIVTL